MPTATREPRLLKMKEVCQMLNVKPPFVKKLYTAGRLKRLKFGAHTHRYTLDSIERLLASKGD